MRAGRPVILAPEGETLANAATGGLYGKAKESYSLIKSVVTGDAKTGGHIIGNTGANLLDAAVATGAGKAISALRGAGAAEATTTLYRGVNEAHPGFENATNGVAEPIGGNASAAAHNAGNTASPFTSWTTNPDVATNFALRPGGSGVMMEVTVPASSTVASPSSANVNLIQSPGTVVNESEVLLKGTVSHSGASMTGRAKA